MLLWCFFVQLVALFSALKYSAFPDGGSSALKYKLSQKLWSGLCFVTKTFALAPLSPKPVFIHLENLPMSQKRPIWAFCSNPGTLICLDRDSWQHLYTISHFLQQYLDLPCKSLSGKMRLPPDCEIHQPVHSRPCAFLRLRKDWLNPHLHRWNDWSLPAELRYSVSAAWFLFFLGPS